MTMEIIQETPPTTNVADLLDARITKAREELNRIICDPTSNEKAIASASASLQRLMRSKAVAAKAAPVDDTGEECEDDDQRAADRQLVKDFIRNKILSQRDYYYVHDMEKFLLHSPATNEWITVSPNSLKNDFGMLDTRSSNYELFIDVLKEDNRWFMGRTSSVRNIPGKLNMLRPKMVQPEPGEYHPVFDLLTASLCGDKDQNIDHLEKVIVAKWCNPANYLLPVVCFNDDGATGKSLFVGKVMTTLFGASAVAPNTRIGDFVGQFNGHLAGKLVILINENADDRYDEDAMKRLTGSETVSFTNKGQMPYDADCIWLLFVSGNGISGSIALTGGDVDRRFSVITGDQPLYTYTVEYLRLTDQPDATTDDAQAWMKSTGQHILSDPIQVSRWLNHLIQKHGRLTDVPALHGDDYQAAVGIQKAVHTAVFEAFFNRPNFTYTKRSHLYDFYTHELRNQRRSATLGKGKFYKAAEVWLKKSGLPIIAAKANWEGSTADVFVASDLTGGKARPTLTPNDATWFTTSDNRINWKLSI